MELTKESFMQEVARQMTAGRSMAAIARELCVTRQAVYFWLQGGNPSKMVLKLATKAGWGTPTTTETPQPID